MSLSNHFNLSVKCAINSGRNCWERTLENMSRTRSSGSTVPFNMIKLEDTNRSACGNQRIGNKIQCHIFQFQILKDHLEE